MHTFFTMTYIFPNIVLCGTLITKLTPKNETHTNIIVGIRKKLKKQS